MNKKANGSQAHWDEVYRQKQTEEQSWYQAQPVISLQMLEESNLPLDAHIIDIGGGDGLFVDALLERGYKNVYVLDISAKAIAKAKQRLGDKAAAVNWIIGDITAFTPGISFDLWHDRAAFHFLTTADQVNRYVTTANAAVRQNGIMILGTFDDAGPATCSGLEVQRYNETSLSARFAGGFKKIGCLHEDHRTPSGTQQRFLYCKFRREASVL